MFKIIESINPEYIRFKSLNNRKIIPGTVIQLIEEDSDFYCTPSDGVRIFGICDHPIGEYIKIWTQTIIFRTDNYEPGLVYKSGDPVYVNKYGILTTEKNSPDSIIVAHVISDYRLEKGFIEFNWI